MPPSGYWEEFTPKQVVEIKCEESVKKWLEQTS
jgi:hypothetical protein